jgi:uncharacterized protein YaiE (UPF0345 family)
MKIFHSSFYSGAIQTVFCEEKGIKTTMGLILPGEYVFGIAGLKESITVVSGRMKINGAIYFSEDSDRGKCVLRSGVAIKVKVTQLSAFKAEVCV